jgi:hypothetical protein
LFSGYGWDGIVPWFSEEEGSLQMRLRAMGSLPHLPAGYSGLAAELELTSLSKDAPAIDSKYCENQAAELVVPNRTITDHTLHVLF